jgi:hypothetical protein
MRRILPLLAMLWTAACVTGGDRVPVDPDARSPERVVESEDGRWRIHVHHLTLAAPALPGAPARLSLRATLDLGDPDHLLADGDPLVGLQREAGVAYPVTPHGYEIDAAKGDIRLRNVDVGEAAAVLARLDLECRVIAVRSSKIHAFDDLGPVRKPGLEAAPFVLTVTGERHNVWVAAARMDPPPDAPAAAELGRLLDHGWASSSATLHDAEGRRLFAWGGSGTAGGTVTGYGAPIDETPFLIAYPVSLELAVPERYEVKTVRFRIENLRLPDAE